MGFENNFNGIYFHHHFYLKTDVSRNGYSPGYSERDTSSVYLEVVNNMKHSVPAVEADGGDLSQFISTASMLIPTSQSRSTRVI